MAATITPSTTTEEIYNRQQKLIEEQTKHKASLSQLKSEFSIIQEHRNLVNDRDFLSMKITSLRKTEADALKLKSQYVSFLKVATKERTKEMQGLLDQVDSEIGETQTKIALSESQQEPITNRINALAKLINTPVDDRKRIELQANIATLEGLIKEEAKQIKELASLIVESTSQFNVKPQRKRTLDTGSLTDDELLEYSGSKIKIIRRMTEIEKTASGITDSLILELDDGTKLCCSSFVLLERKSSDPDNNNNNAL